MIRLVYITVASSEEATKIGRALVGERLAACINILPGMRSIYRWEGKIEEADEVVLIAKTDEVLVNDLIARVKALHSHKAPCALSIPVLSGNPDYLRWLSDEVGKPITTSGC